MRKGHDFFSVPETDPVRFVLKKCFKGSTTILLQIYGNDNRVLVGRKKKRRESGEHVNDYKYTHTIGSTSKDGGDTFGKGEKYVNWIDSISRDFV